jgi:hypothetical protein
MTWSSSSKPIRPDMVATRDTAVTERHTWFSLCDADDRSLSFLSFTIPITAFEIVKSRQRSYGILLLVRASEASFYVVLNRALAIQHRYRFT